MKAAEIVSEIIEIEDMAKDIRKLRLSTPDFSFLPGQFISIKVPGKGIRRSYSICSSPNDGSIEICFKKIENGLGTTYLYSLKEKDKIEFLGPLGVFPIEDYNDIKNATFISAGTGIAPFRSIIHSILESGYGGKISLYSGFRQEDSILFRDEFIRLKKKHPNFEYETILSKAEDEKDQGHVQDLIEKKVNDDGGIYFICGMNTMIEEVTNILQKKEYLLRGFT